MKGLILAAGLLISGLANGATIKLHNPSALQIAGASCGDVPIRYQGIGFNTDGLYFQAYASVTMSCSSGGRGSRPRRIRGRALVKWDLGGNIVSVVRHRTRHTTDGPWINAARTAFRVDRISGGTQSDILTLTTP